MKRDTMLVHLDIDCTPAPIIDFALDLADKLEMDVIGFSAAQPGLLIPGDIDGSASIEAMKLETKEIEARLKVLEEAFNKATQGARFASWRSEVGGSNTGTADAGARRRPCCYADAIRRLSAGLSKNGRSRLAGAFRRQAGAFCNWWPLTFERQEHRCCLERYSRESRRAVADAMPFLRRADNVVVATIEESNLPDAKGSAADVADYLVKLGVRARPEVIEIGLGQTADALVEVARTFDADLLVSGGYGHSRIREWVFGGVTRSLLNTNSINRLMSS